MYGKGHRATAKPSSHRRLRQPGTGRSHRLDIASSNRAALSSSSTQRSPVAESAASPDLRVNPNTNTNTNTGAFWRHLLQGMDYAKAEDAFQEQKAERAGRKGQCNFEWPLVVGWCVGRWRRLGRRISRLELQDASRGPTVDPEAYRAPSRYINDTLEGSCEEKSQVQPHFE